MAEHPPARDFRDEVRRLAAADGRYDPEAFVLVWEALQRTTELIEEGTLRDLALQPGDRQVKEGRGRFHVHGRELLEGFRVHVREQFGAMALFMLDRLGMRRSEDVGEIVFLMVNAGLMGKRDDDSIDDFAGGYDFARAFAPGDEANGDDL